MDYLKNIDRQLLKWAYQKPYRPSVLIKALIFMGDGPFWMIVLLCTAVAGQLLHMESFNCLAILLMFGLMISQAGFVVCKTRIRRMRPYADTDLHRVLHLYIENRDPGHGSKEWESFPSGHALWTTLCVSLICSQFGYIGLFLFGWMIPVMMFLRLHLGVHYPSDVLAGVVLGIINATITLLIAPGLVDYLNGLKGHAAFLYGYWSFICVFLIIGFKSWLKRV